MHCKDCGRTAFHPACCLVCGEVIYATRFCCPVSGIVSGPQQKLKKLTFEHAEMCGAGTGVFLMLDIHNGVTAILLHRDKQRAKWSSPYLDEHGEVRNSCSFWKRSTRERERKPSVVAVFGLRNDNIALLNLRDSNRLRCCGTYEAHSSFVCSPCAGRHWSQPWQATVFVEGEICCTRRLLGVYGSSRTPIDGLIHRTVYIRLITSVCLAAHWTLFSGVSERPMRAGQRSK